MSKTIKPRAGLKVGGQGDLPASTEPDQPITLEVMVRLQAVALPEADGGYTVLIRALGCATQGESVEDAQTNAIEAAEGWLTSQHKRMKDAAIQSTHKGSTPRSPRDRNVDLRARSLSRPLAVLA